MSIVNGRSIAAFSTIHCLIGSAAPRRRFFCSRRSALPYKTVSPRPSQPRCSSIQSTLPAAEEVLKSVAARSGLSDGQVDSLFKLGELLLRENAKYNLTAIRTRDGVMMKHIVDSLSLLPVIDDEDASTVIDVGAGAGFPGIVLAIARPNLRVTLLDSVRKKTRFHQIALESLQLPNVDSLWVRAEDAGRNHEEREKYGVAVARSVAELRVLAELCLPLVEKGGCFIAQKSVDPLHTEIEAAQRAIKVLGGSLERISDAWSGEDLMLQTSSIEDNGRTKSMIVIRKVSETPSKYPRKPGIPIKAPL